MPLVWGRGGRPEGARHDRGARDYRRTTEPEDANDRRATGGARSDVPWTGTLAGVCTVRSASASVVELAEKVTAPFCELEPVTITFTEWRPPSSDTKAMPFTASNLST